MKLVLSQIGNACVQIVNEGYAQLSGSEGAHSTATGKWL